VSTPELPRLAPDKLVPAGLLTYEQPVAGGVPKKRWTNLTDSATRTLLLKLSVDQESGDTSLKESRYEGQEYRPLRVSSDPVSLLILRVSSSLPGQGKSRRRVTVGVKSRRVGTTRTLLPAKPSAIYQSSVDIAQGRKGGGGPGVRDS
jgi:hypothetical protein